MNLVKNSLRKSARLFYQHALEMMVDENIPFLIGGAFALRHYTGIHRFTKDIDVFCKPSSYAQILKLFSKHGFKTEITDSRWLAKIFYMDFFVDIIFNTSNNIGIVDQTWFDNANKGELFHIPLWFIAPEEMIWSKLYVQNRERYDGADINHIILRCADKINWNRLLNRMDQHWHLLLAQVLLFQFTYPSEREKIPKWLFEELLYRAKEQYQLPRPLGRVCLGPLIDHAQYDIDISKWNYKTLH